MSHVFISYSSKDIDYAHYLRMGLENAGIPTWMDQNEIKVGDKWIKSLENALDQSVALVVLMSHHSKASEWVDREIQYAEDRNIPIFPILISGKPFFRLVNKQYEDMTDNFYQPLPSRLIHELFNTLPGVQNDVRFSIVDVDVREVEVDVLILKYARGFHGADRLVKLNLDDAQVEVNILALQSDGYVFVETQGAIQAKHVLFVATPRLSKLDYVGVREFLIRSFFALQKELPQVETVAMTIHGVGVGLDEGETFRAQMGGILDALQQTQLQSLNGIQLTEIHPYRFINLQKLAHDYLADVGIAQKLDDTIYLLTPQVTEALPTPQAPKPRAITVFFPHNSDLDDIYYYGILRPAGMQGFLCENVGVQTDIKEITELEKLERFIDHAQMVFFYLTDEPISPQLAFQIGLVHGKGKRTLYILAEDSTNPSLDMLNDEMIIRYKRISDLETTILQMLKAIDG